MNNRERHAEGTTSTTRMAQQLDRAPQACASVTSAVIWQASSVRVPPVLESPVVISRIQQLKGNRAVSQLLAVQQSAETQGAVAKPNHTGLPAKLKAGIESLSGLSMDAVRVHYNSSQPAQLNALAYAQGTDIHIAPGQERHLPHEAWHVVQQAQGRVQPTIHMKGGVPINDDKGLEREADVMGQRATLEGNQHFDVRSGDGSVAPHPHEKNEVCQCAACSAGRAPSVPRHISTSAGKVHQLTSIKISDGKNQEVGQSGISVENFFTSWPRLHNKLKSCARYVASQDRIRPAFECAEPDALRKLLWSYRSRKSTSGTPIETDGIGDVYFVERADDGKAKDGLAPCSTCKEWVIDNPQGNLKIKEAIHDIIIEIRNEELKDKVDQEGEDAGAKEKISPADIRAEVKKHKAHSDPDPKKIATILAGKGILERTKENKVWVYYLICDRGKFERGIKDAVDEIVASEYKDEKVAEIKNDRGEEKILAGIGSCRERMDIIKSQIAKLEMEEKDETPDAKLARVKELQGLESLVLELEGELAQLWKELAYFQKLDKVA